ncbi:DEAD/DEAH box helicase [Rhabdothermincola salaria]|uniref:DEAD/DEAH box helicase n=1 Tax=Rhabdothermincola salaria TaxID=2903142 RepID=UPI0032119B5E
MTGATLGERVPARDDPDEILDAFTGWVADRGLSLYPAQEEALLEILGGAHVIVNTPTGSGKSLVAIAAHFATLARPGARSFYTAPIKALVSEKFFDLSHVFGARNVGMLTGDAAVNHDAPIICCTAEVLANMALRHGRDAPVDQVVMDEFHYFADPDRGWAWQVPLLELVDAQQVLMSATLGDVSAFETDLQRRTGRPVAVVRSATRPVPLVHHYRVTPLTETITELLETHQAPVYLVHFTQAGAVEQAQSLMSLKLCSREEKDAIAAAIGSFRFAAGFGRTLSKYVRNGIGVHHAGMLPKYRRLVERLAQEGLLKVICGTDTLGVGINVPIRTVVFTSLSKYDGIDVRLLSAREFHQIGGRAGRAGYDTMGTVVVQAPEHAIANAKMVAKAAGDPQKLKRMVKKKPPPGMVSWGEPTFTRLVDAEPEPLTSSFAVSHTMVLDVLDRPGDGRTALHTLLTDNYERDRDRQAHLDRAAEIEASLLAGGVIEELAEPDEDGRTVRVTVELQDDFALNQPLAPFALAALELLDPDDVAHPLDVVSVIESVLDDPRQVIAAQLDKARGEAVARMKAEGMEYDERMAELDLITHPRPLADLLEPAFDTYREAHPWVADSPLRPKSVVRDMYERAMGFGDYVAFYRLGRSEGTLLRYLTDAYRTLVKTVPEDLKTEGLVDLTEWLGELVRQVDSSLLDEWEALRDPDPEHVVDELEVRRDAEPPRFSENRRAFTVAVRNAMFRRVELASRRHWQQLAGLGLEDGEVNRGWRAADWEEAFAPYWAEHDAIVTDADARNPTWLEIAESPTEWRVRQVLADPEEDREWGIDATVDLEASDEAGEVVVRPVGVTRRGAPTPHG